MYKLLYFIIFTMYKCGKYFCGVDHILFVWHDTRLDDGYVHTGADPFWIRSRLDLIHTGPALMPLI